VKREDEELVKLIRENGTKQWSQIANQLNSNLGVNRNGKQCRERWVNFLNPEIKKDPFSLEEDIMILQKRLSIGNKWSEIIKEMPGRTENNVKNRFNMMFKNIKDEFIKNRNHQSVFVMDEKCVQDSSVVED
jgi:myb proto-oncogene protein